jgi:hypothetical protein
MIYKIFDVTNYYSLKILIIVCLSVNSVTAQDSKLNNEEQTKANEVLAKSHKAIGLETKKMNIEKISLIFNVLRNTKLSIKENKIERDTQDSGEREFHIMLPSMFRYLETMILGDTTSIAKFILNDNLLNEDRYTVWEGRRTEIQIPGQENPTDEQKKQLIQDKREEVFFILFPILLESSHLFPLEFKHVGKAELGGEKADVLEAALNKEIKIRLFFDEKTRLLKMLLTESKFKNGSESEEKRFYSDYKNVEGLMIAKKINIETKQISKRLNFQSVEELILKSVKINPTFKPSFFEVKKK